MAKEKLYRSVNGDYLYLFNWIDGGFNDVWAPSKKEAYKRVMNEALDTEKRYPDHAKLLPIKKISILAQQTFSTLVNKILIGKSEKLDTKTLEHEIDLMVYHLYELTYEEACIIEPELTLEDFEKYRLEAC